jgi:hypothetical protein
LSKSAGPGEFGPEPPFFASDPFVDSCVACFVDGDVLTVAEIARRMKMSKNWVRKKFKDVALGEGKWIVPYEAFKRRVRELLTRDR